MRAIIPEKKMSMKRRVRRGGRKPHREEGK
jgi:hypothetical protein